MWFKFKKTAAILLVVVALIFSVSVHCFANNREIDIKDISVTTHKDFVNRVVDFGINIKNAEDYLSYYRVEARYDGISRRINYSDFDENGIAVIATYNDASCEDVYEIEIMFIDIFAWTPAHTVKINETGHFFDDTGKCLVCGKENDIKYETVEPEENNDVKEEIETEEETETETEPVTNSPEIIKKLEEINAEIKEMYDNKGSFSKEQSEIFDKLLDLYNACKEREIVRAFEINEMCDYLKKIKDCNTTKADAEPVPQTEQEKIPETGIEKSVSLFVFLAAWMSVLGILSRKKRA